MQIQQGRALVNDTELYYEQAGEGSPLVLVHGHTLDTRMWDDQFEHFAAHYKVIRYDLRGYGQSALPTDASYSRADDLQALLSYLGIARAHVLGLSRGGTVAVDFALSFPNMTDTLVLADAALREFQWQSFGEFSAAVNATAREQGIDAAKTFWQQGSLFAPAVSRPQVAARLQQMVARYSGWHWVNKDPIELLDPPPTHQLPSIAAPTLVIVGEHDLADFHAIADILHRRIPRATKVVMPGVGHMSNMEDPARFNALVLAFLAAQR